MRRRTVGLSDSRTVASAGRAVGCLAILVSVSPSVRPSLAAQDTSAIDRGVRIGIIYRPGVRPGMVVLPVHAPALDSMRTIVSRDLDYSDRFEHAVGQLMHRKPKPRVLERR